MSTAKRQQEIYASYDEAEIFESELDYRVEQAKEEGEYSEVDGDSHYRNQVARSMHVDSYLYQDAWESFTESIQCWMDSHKKGNRWYVEGNNMGWQKRDGVAFIKATTASELFERTLPKTDLTIRTYDNGDSLCMVVYHHDSPCGESYTVFPDESLECILADRKKAQRRGFTLKAIYNGVKASKGDWSHEFDWDHTIAVVEGLYYETR